MSQLQKKITKIQRREGTSMGFGAATREQPRAMLLAAIANDAQSAKAAADAGADVIILRATASSAASTVESLTADKLTVGVWSEGLDEAASNALSKAGCDFVVSTLEGTASAAVDTERMGQLVVASESMDDTTLRSLAPLGLDGLFVDRPSGAMTLAQQLGLVRIASFASAQLMVTIDAGASVSDLRVLRDSGVATVVVAAGTSKDQVTSLIESLKAVPAPRKGRDGGGREMAIVPSLAAGKHEEEDDDDDDE